MAVWCGDPGRPGVDHNTWLTLVVFVRWQARVAGGPGFGPANPDLPSAATDIPGNLRGNAAAIMPLTTLVTTIFGPITCITGGGGRRKLPRHLRVEAGLGAHGLYGLPGGMVPVMPSCFTWKKWWPTIPTSEARPAAESL